MAPKSFINEYTCPERNKRGIKDKARLYDDIKNVEYFGRVALVQLVTDLAIFFMH